jgi:hypothetical protein
MRPRVALAQRRGPRGEARELLAEERVAALVGGGEVGHRGDQLDGRLGGRRLHHACGLLRVARPSRPMPVSSLTCTRPPPRAATAATKCLAPCDDVGARGQRVVELLRAERAEDQQRRVDAVRAQLRGLAGA